MTLRMTAGVKMAGTILTATAEEPSGIIELETVESKVNAEVQFLPINVIHNDVEQHFQSSTR